VSRRSRAGAPHLERHAAEEGERAAVIGLEDAGSTPILREYRAVKQRYPDAILLARLGDFFELFGDDAERAAPILGVALTGRSFGNAGRLPMCGVPHHAATGYVRRLLDAGLQVALWDQVEPAGGADGTARGLVRREVTRVITPGMVVDDEFLDPGAVVRCVALLPAGEQLGLAAFDASSGDLQLCEMRAALDGAAVAEECERLAAAELLLPEGVAVPEQLTPRAARTTLPRALFDPGRGGERLREVTGTASLLGFGIAELGVALGAGGAVIAYCERSRMVLEPGFVRPRLRPLATVMRLDPATRRNLEVLAPLGATGPGLLQMLDRTRTPMGARLLRTRMQEPLLDPAAIDARLDAVESLRSARDARARLRAALAEVRDLERLTGRCVQLLASPRDLGAVRDACAALPRCAEAIADAAASSTTLSDAAARCDPPPGLAERLAAMVVDDPPATARDGGAIRAGADPELDQLRAAGSDARSFIAGLEERERSRTGIRSLRVGYNRVFGYYLEVSNAHRDAVPADYVRKQTLVGAERYITPDLKEQESTVLGARERSLAREAELLRDCAAAVAAEVARLLDAAAALAELDVAQALATVADEAGWVRPTVDSSTLLEIEGGRHPLVERSLAAGAFVPNDCAVAARGGAPAAQVVVLTGPNMAGKSTYLRQVAVIALLAQVGCFVPAARVRLGVCDRIFTRVGAHDDLAAGLSTFMVEMTETAAILNAATVRSLVVLDEIGRGTSTYDGLSIAQAVVEHLHDAPPLGCRTLFATHYHELTALAGRLPGVRNARVDVLEEGGAVVFLHRIVEGGADRSYGLHVARLAGLPPGVLERARVLLATLEAERPLTAPPAPADQLALPLRPAGTHPLVSELADLDLDGLTPLAALNKLAEWRQRLDHRR
jgi:DNA mismatch repair protein MutS